MRKIHRKRSVRSVAGVSAADVLLMVSGGVVAVMALASVYLIGYSDTFARARYSSTVVNIPAPTLDKSAYNMKMLELALGTTTIPAALASSTLALASSTLASADATTTASTTLPLWPVRKVYPEYGALLPFNRIVAYYGTFSSAAMGVLGQYPPDEMLARLKAAADEWRAADPSTPVIPALDYIAVIAQAHPGADGKYRARASDEQIQKAIDLASKIHALVFLDVQVGLSDLQSELPALAPFLKLPQVHLAIDPEFSMKGGEPPGTVIGTFSADDINYAAGFLANIVRENHLPPKILVVHRFTQAMVTDYEEIDPLPQVQIVMDMDGWGPPGLKIGTYQAIIRAEPVQFTGFKLFYKNDRLPPSSGLMTPEEILRLLPQPSFIQYQ